MIINIRGTFGSGKTTVVREILKRYEGVPTETNEKGKPLNYKATLQNGKALYVIGSYANACGGCDGIQPYSEIWPRVESFAKIGHVLFEGAMVSSSYGTIGKNSERFGDEFVFAFMDTPLEVCYQRVAMRRGVEVLDEKCKKSIREKYENIIRSIDKIEKTFNRRVVMLNYKHPITQVLRILYNG